MESIKLEEVMKKIMKNLKAEMILMKLLNHYFNQLYKDMKKVYKIK